MNESDLLLVVGASFANHTGIAPYKPIVQIDDAPAAIGRFHPVDVGLLGDAAVTLRALLDRSVRTGAEDQRADVAARWAIWRAEKARRAADDRGRGRRQCRRVRRAVRALPGRRRRSPSTSATTPTRSAATSRAPGSRCSCPATSARSASATRPRWVPGPPTRPAGRRGHRRRRVRRSTSPS
jgi:thiamine pyrophosphate-dependent acetolactate synthase large subunit-like protein